MFNIRFMNEAINRCTCVRALLSLHPTIPAPPSSPHSINSRRCTFPFSRKKNFPFLILAMKYKTKIRPVRKCVFVQLGQTSSRSLKAVKDLSKSFPAANIPIFLLLSISFWKGIQLGKYLWTNTFTFFYVNPEGGDQDAAKLNVSSFKGKEV